MNTKLDSIRLTRRLALATVLIACLALTIAAPATAQLRTTSDLLLPYFEVDLGGSQLTTLFAVGNASDEPVDILIRVSSNWGVKVLDVPYTLAPRQVKTVNLRDWLQRGHLLHRDLTADELAHVQAALCGERSPTDDLYYSSLMRPDLAVGSVTIRMQSSGRPDVLWGDYFVVDPGQDFAQGDSLVDIDQLTECSGLCLRHALRFALGAGFDGGTQLVIWTERIGAPSVDPFYPQGDMVALEARFFDEPGDEIAERQHFGLPLEVIDVADFNLPEDLGSIDLFTEERSFIGVRYTASDRYSVALPVPCMPDIPDDPPEPPQNPTDDPEIDIEKATNGHDADTAPGPYLDLGSSVEWSYLVTNTGDTLLEDIQVTDDQGVAVSCPATELEAGDSMTCSGNGTAVACQYQNIGGVSGVAPDGTVVSDEDPSHYYGNHQAGLTIEKATNGQDADTAPGVLLDEGDAVTWTYAVTNTGNVALTNVQVSDDQGVAVSCPSSTLAPGASMTCTGHGIAIAGQYANIGTASGQPPCGPAVSDSDPSHYFGQGTPPPPPGGDQGCTPGYWKNHTDSWPPTGYSPSQSVGSVFGAASAYPAIGGASLLGALNFNGGSGVEGGARILMRAAVAGLLDASHPGVDYPRLPGDVISDVNAALASGDRGLMLALAASIDSDNNLGCPLN